jgi:tRNA(Ile)-lysidine synthase
MDGHTMKLSDFWVNQKLPRRARAKFPLVLAGDEIAWVPGFRLAHPFRLREETRRAVLLRLIRET